MSKSSPGAKIGILMIIIAVWGCRTAPRSETIGPTTDEEARFTHERLHGALWMNPAAEYDACCRQSYKLAMQRFEEGLRDPTWTAALEQTGEYAALDPVVIMDLDETVINNVAFQSALVAQNKDYDQALWDSWAKVGKAKDVPGAIDFIKGVINGKKARVFYITSRTPEVEAQTRKNLLDLGIPVSEDPLEILSAKENGDDKSAQRKFVAQKYRIVLLIGDDLNDFVAGAKTNPADRVKLARQHLDRWGHKWILLPNPLYGSWEGSLYDYNNKLSDKEKLQRKYSHLQPFQP